MFSDNQPPPTLTITQSAFLENTVYKVMHKPETIIRIYK